MKTASLLLALMTALALATPCAPAALAAQGGGDAALLSGFAARVAGGGSYGTLSEAISEAGSGGTVLLLRGVSLDSQIAVSKDITLDLCGHTIESTASGDAFVINDGNLTVKNGAVTSLRHSCFVAAGGTAAFSNVELAAYQYAVMAVYGSVLIGAGRYYSINSGHALSNMFGTIQKSGEGLETVPETGWVTAKEIIVSPAAETGGAKYHSLQAALDAAGPEHTVTLLRDTEPIRAVAYTGGGEVTINCAGKSISSGHIEEALLEVAGGSLIIKNGSIISGAGTALKVSSGMLCVSEANISGRNHAVEAFGGSAVLGPGSYSCVTEGSAAMTGNVAVAEGCAAYPDNWAKGVSGFEVAEAPADTAPPAVNNKSVSVSGITETSAILSWEAATDDITMQNDLKYYYLLTTDEGVQTIADIDGCAAAPAEASGLSVLLSSLERDTDYYFLLYAADEAGNRTLYHRAPFRTAAGGPEPGSGFNYTPSKPCISFTETKNGSISAKPENPVAGTVVTVTAAPVEGYLLTSLIVRDMNGNQLACVSKGGGVFLFTYGGSPVTICAEFLLEPGGRTSFFDVDETDWFYDEVKYVSAAGLMQGTGSGLFEPELCVSRAMAAVVLWRMAGGPEPDGDSHFTDLKQDWYKPAVHWAAETGIAEGYGNGTFAPGRDVTCEELAVLLYRYTQYMGGPSDPGQFSPPAFRDADKISGWAYDAVCFCVTEGLIESGPDNSLGPAGTVSRAELAAVLYRWLENRK